METPFDVTSEIEKDNDTREIKINGKKCTYNNNNKGEVV